MHSHGMRQVLRPLIKMRLCSQEAKTRDVTCFRGLKGALHTNQCSASHIRTTARGSVTRRWRVREARALVLRRRALGNRRRAGIARSRCKLNERGAKRQSPSRGAPLRLQHGAPQCRSWRAAWCTHAATNKRPGFLIPALALPRRLSSALRRRVRPTTGAASCGPAGGEAGNPALPIGRRRRPRFTFCDT